MSGKSSGGKKKKKKADVEAPRREEEDEKQVEYREVDPMAVIEEKINLLRSWLEFDPQHDELEAKHTEYMGLMDELEILGKKMRKTDRLLDENHHSDSTKTNLLRKRKQYEKEVTDIVLYAEQDVFFDGKDGDMAEGGYVGHMHPNALLGRPLETLTEMSGFEDSKAWNDSRSDWSISGKSPRTPRKGHKRVDPEALRALDLTQNENLKLVKKQLIKTKAMFEDSTDDRERKELMKQVTEYTQILDKAKQGRRADTDDDDDDNDVGGGNGMSEVYSDGESKETKKRSKKNSTQNGGISSLSPGQTIQSPSPVDEDDERYTLLKRKLAKATTLAKNSTDDKNVRKLQTKIADYIEQLRSYPAWTKDQYSLGYGEKEEEKEVKLEKRPSKNERQRRPSLDDSQWLNGSMDTIMIDGNESMNHLLDDERGTTELIQKKLKKVERMMDDLLERRGDEARYTNEYRKLQKKRTQYMTELANRSESISRSSLNKSATSEQSILISPSKGFDSPSVHESANASSSSMFDGSQQDAVILLQKKLKKVEKMMSEMDSGTKEYIKLEKKRIQYRRELAGLDV